MAATCMTLKIQAGDFEQGFSQVILELQTPPENGRGNPTRLIFPLPSSPDLPLLYRQWQQQYRYLTRGGRGFKNAQATNFSVAECKQCSQTLRDRLNQWLQPLKQQLDITLNSQDEVYFWISAHKSLTDSTKDLLYRLPWHFWDLFPEHCPVEVILSLSEQTEPAGKPQRVKRKVRILGILGSSEGIDLEADRQLIDQLPKAEPHFLDQPNRSKFEKLWDENWDILFYGGHSESQEDSQTGLLDINSQESLDIKDIRRSLKTAINKGLKLAIFNSCDGLGLARQLADLDLPFIIVWREPVPNKVAQEFLKYFLQSFARGKSLVVSIWEARVKLQELKDLEKLLPGITGLPIICQNAAAVLPTWNGWLYEERDKYFLRTALVATFAATAMVMGMRFSELLEGWELSAYDLLMQLRPQEEPMDDRLLVITIDEEDKDYQDRQGMKRRVYKDSEGKPQKVSLAGEALSKLLAKLEPHKPIAIGLDILRDFPSSEDYPPLGKQLQQTKNLFVICQGATKKDAAIPPPPEFNTPQNRNFSPENRVGFSDVVPDPDQVVRRYLWSADFGEASACLPSKDDSQPAFSLLLAQHYLKAHDIPLDFEKLEKGYWETTGSNARLIAWDSSIGGAYRNEEQGKGYQMMLNYRNVPKNISRSRPLKDVLDGSFDPESVRNKIILIGVTAKGKDEFLTPLGGDNQIMHGVFIHAHAISQILSAVPSKKDEKTRSLIQIWHPWGETGWIVGWAIVGGLLAWRIERLKLFILAEGVAILVLSSVCYILFLNGWWVPFIPPMLVLVLIGGAVIVSRLVIQPSRLPGRATSFDVS